MSLLVHRATLWLSSTIFLTGCTLADWLPKKAQTDYQISDVTGFVNQIIKWLAAFGGLVAFFIMIAGYQYLMSAGNEEGVTRAKESIRYSAIGMLFLVAGYGIVRLITALLVDQPTFNTIFQATK